MTPVEIVILAIVGVMLLVSVATSSYMLAVPLSSDAEVTPPDSSTQNLTSLSDVSAEDPTSTDTLVFDTAAGVFVLQEALAVDPDSILTMSDLTSVSTQIRLIYCNGQKFGNIVTLSFSFDHDDAGNFIAPGTTLFEVPEAWRPQSVSAAFAPTTFSNLNAYGTYLHTDGTFALDDHNYGSDYGPAVGSMSYTVA